MTAMLATRTHTRSRCLWLMLRDGTQLGVTNHDRNLIVDMADFSGEPVVCRADTGAIPSDISLSVGMSADNFEVAGPLGDLITREGVLGRRFHRARARLFDIDWTSANPEVLPMMGGLVTDCRIERNRFVMEVRSHFDRYNQMFGSVLTPYCRADFGDVKCGKTRPSYPTTITAANSGFLFTVDLAAAHPDDFFNLGTVAFTSGALAGTEEMEIFDYDGASATVELLAPMPSVPEVGDALTVFRGCSKLKMSEENVPTCAFYENVLRFRGFDQVSGSDTYLRIQTGPS